jgi:dihydroorotate dehydrogenase electron transfer subunit
MSLARIDPDGTCGVMVESVGDATKALHNLEHGQALGIRGPFGNHFRLVGGRVLLVSGGMGIAPLIPLSKSLRNLRL